METVLSEVTESEGIGSLLNESDGSTEDAIGTDYNNDRAVDLVVTGHKNGPTIFAESARGKVQERRALVDV